MTFQNEQNYLTQTETIFQCYSDVAPNRITKVVTKLCTIEWSPDVPYSTLPEHANPQNVKYKRLDFEIEFTALGATAEFAIYIANRKQGTVNSVVEIQYEN